tara:strand:- start:91 stop:408 length:318 start_codon:yes stop_codon:yes gene_type:complete
MIIVSSPTIPDKRIIKTFGLVKGNTIRARHIGKDVLALFKNIVGGEILEYTKLMAESREQAIDRMIESAEELGANAIISCGLHSLYHTRRCSRTYGLRDCGFSQN